MTDRSLHEFKAEFELFLKSMKAAWEDADKAYEAMKQKVEPGMEADANGEQDRADAIAYEAKPLLDEYNKLHAIAEAYETGLHAMTEKTHTIVDRITEILKKYPEDGPQTTPPEIIEEERVLIDLFADSIRNGINLTNQILHDGAHRAKLATFPLDQWSYALTSPRYKGGAKSFNVAGKRELRKGATANVIVLLSPADGATTKPLDAYDLRICAAVHSLMVERNRTMSARQIYHAMGYSGEAGGADIEKIESKMLNMSDIWFSIDTQQEANLYPTKPPLRMREKVLNFREALSLEVNGKTRDFAIEPLTFPIIIEQSIQRGQALRVPISALATPWSKTNAHLAIENYLLKRFAQASATGTKILFDTLFLEASIDNDKAKQRLRNPNGKLADVLAFYQEQGLIAAYTITKDAICFKPSAKKSEISPAK